MKNYSKILCFFIILFAFSFTGYSQNNTNSSKEIKSIIAKKRAFNKKNGFGYRVQIYYGNETRAKSLRNKFKYEFPKIYNTLKYEEPYWKVQVGNYKTKLEADKDLIKFQEKFSGIIVPMSK